MAGFTGFEALRDRAIQELVRRRDEERALTAPPRVLDGDDARLKGSGGRAPRESRRPSRALPAPEGEADAGAVATERVRLYTTDTA